jgi:polyisoprenoid-binding protein YceI
MRIHKTLGSLLAVLAVCGSAFAADEYKIDPAHSMVGFSVKHMMVSTVHGRFTDFSGKIIYDDKDPSKSSVIVTIKAASVNTDNTARDNDLRSANFLDVEKFPEITFQSKSVERKQHGFVAHGTLTLHGVPKDVDLTFGLTGPLATPRGKIMGAEAGLTINRQEYGVSWSKALDGGGVMVSDDVRIELSVEARTPPPAPAPGK